MATKDLGTTPTLGANPGADLLNSTTGYDSVSFTDANELRTKVWSELVTRDAREKNVFAKFIGSEGSGKPIVEKTDLSAGGSDKVVFTTVAPIRGQGVRGEAILKNATGSLNFGTFNVEVDLLRHAVSWTQVLKLMRFTGKTLDQLSAEVMSEWSSRMEQDLTMTVLRDTCIAKAGGRTSNASNHLTAYGATAANLLYSEGLSTDIIQEAKQNLIANGGQPMNTGGDENQEIPGYLFFAPDACLRPLRSDPDYLEAITQADARGADNKLYSGSYAKWDNNIIANHNIIIDTAQGRQGSPLAPTAVMSAAGSGGWDDTVATLNDAAPDVGDYYGGTGLDIWANWPGATNETVPGGGGSAYTAGTATDHTVLIVGSDGYRAYKIAGFFTADGGAVAGNSYLKLGELINDGADEGSLGTHAKHISDGGVSLGSGPLTFYLANAAGTPIGYGLMMGEGALYMARGAVTNEQIFHYDDFANSGNDAHLSAVGVQSVYGFAAYQDTNDRIPGVCLVECVRQVPGLAFTGQTAD